jgi:DNA-binding LytR/AlgR family response regulator
MGIKFRSEETVMRILIVEDELLVAQRVERLSRAILADKLEEVRIATTFDEAGTDLGRHRVDLLLLDLNLNGRNGMDLLLASVAAAFQTIIISANTEHAWRAFEHGVIDFVPKPFTRERLALALARVTDHSGRAAQAAKFLAVKKHGRIEIVAVADVVYVQAARNYSELVLQDGRRELHDKPLERLVAILPGGFERIHRSYAVRLADISAIHTQEGSHYEAELRNGVRLPIGRTHYKELRTRLEKPTAED